MKRILIAAAVAGMALMAVPSPAQAGTGTVSVTVVQASTLTMVVSSCDLGAAVTPGSTVSSNNCLTYQVASNDPLGYYVTLDTNTKAVGLSGTSDFKVRRNGQPSFFVLNYNNQQGAGQGTVTTNHWQDTSAANTTTFGDDYQFLADGAQAAGTFSQTITYVAVSK